MRRGRRVRRGASRSVGGIVALAVLALAGCATGSARMQNPETGRTANCTAVAVTSGIADMAVHACVKNYEAAGWQPAKQAAPGQSTD